MIALSYLLALQGSLINEEITPSPELTRSLETLFAQPILAPYKDRYDNARRVGLRIARRSKLLFFTVADPTSSRRGFETIFLENGRFVGFASEDQFADGAKLDRAHLEAALRSAVVQLSPKIARPNLRFRRWGKSLEVSARREAFGRPLADVLCIGINEATGRLSYVDATRYVIDPELYGDDPVLNVEKLREIAYAYYTADAFEQAELVTDEIEIAIPLWIKRERLPRYSGLGLQGIPTYVMKWQVDAGSYFEVQMDARDGTVFHAYRAEAMGVSERPLSPWPTNMRVGKVSGQLARGVGTAGNPVGRRVTFVGGKTVFSGIYEEGKDILWLRRDSRGAYQAFRLAPKLRKAFGEQIRRNDALAEKKS